MLEYVRADLMVISIYFKIIPVFLYLVFFMSALSKIDGVLYKLLFFCVRVRKSECGC